MQIAPGTYIARVFDYGVVPDRQDNPMPWVKFEVTKGEEKGYIRWQGSLDATPNEKLKGKSSRDLTLASLEKCGLVGGMAGVANMFEGLASTSLDPLRDIEIVCEKNGDYLNVKYINLPGEGPGKKFESKEAMKAAFAKLGVSVAAPGKNYLG